MKRRLLRFRFLRSIQWRLVLILVLITFVLMSVVWVFLNSQVEKIFYTEFKDNIETNYEVLGITEDNTSYSALINTLRNNPIIAGFILGIDKSFTVINKETTEVLYSSDELYQIDKIKFKNEIFKAENLLSVLASESQVIGEDQGYTKAESGDFYSYVKTQKLTDGDYILFFKYSRARALLVLKEFSNVILMGTLLALAVAGIIGSLLSSTITKPINEIMHKAKKITDGDFGYNLVVQSHDELGKLTQTFNYMSDRLKSMLGEVTSEKKKLEAILNYMTDGIIAYNSSGEAILINPATKKLLGNKVSQVLYFDKFMIDLSIDLTMERIVNENAVCAPLQRIEYTDRFFKIQFALFTNEADQLDGIILVIQDITEEHRLENMRKEFVANVSHELRTPLTSVKSYTETLLDGAVQDHEITEQFLTVINDETDRMTRLVKDLLTLSQHDGGIILNIEDVSIVDLLESCVDRVKREARLKNQEIRIKTKQGIPVIKADRYRIDQLLINIIGNSIKYTPENGRIIIQIFCDKEYVIISVEDNGIGIPPEDVNRIFERFYRVDKARSRQLGGTGLGLAISKEIALLHGGDITVKSKLGKGTQIHIKLPIRKAHKKAQ